MVVQDHDHILGLTTCKEGDTPGVATSRSKRLEPQRPGRPAAARGRARTTSSRPWKNRGNREEASRLLGIGKERSIASFKIGSCRIRFPRPSNRPAATWAGRSGPGHKASRLERKMKKWGMPCPITPLLESGPLEWCAIPPFSFRNLKQRDCTFIRQLQSRKPGKTKRKRRNSAPPKNASC